MAEHPKQDSPSKQTDAVSEAKRSHNVMLTFVVFALLAGLVGFTGLLANIDHGWTNPLFYGSLMLAGFFVGIFIMFIQMTESTGRRIEELVDQQQRVVDLLAELNDHVLLSDAAKRIAYRANDREALRRAIEEDIAKGDLDAAMVLVNEMSRTYGYRQEAETFREEIEQARTEESQARLAEAIVSIDQLLSEKEWDIAVAEAAKVQRLYPDAPQAKGLDDYVQNAITANKRDIERRFMEAYNHEDWDTAYAVIPEMDRYFTAAEASRFHDAVKNVIAMRKENLRTQFQLALEDKDWHAATVTAEQIIAEFPTIKMAEEARSLLEELKKRESSSSVRTTL